MEPLIKRDDYIKRVNKLANAFPLLLLVGSVCIVFLYHSINLMLQQNLDNLFGIEQLSNSFFQGTVITVVIYFIKSRVIGAVVRVKPTDFASGEVQGYLPCVVGTLFYKHQVGNLIVEDHQLHLYIKKVDGFMLDSKWDDLSKVKVTTVKETYNIMMLLVFGVRESIQISDGRKTVNIIFPQPTITVKEINEFIKSHII